jgi:hypothetical protein
VSCDGDANASSHRPGGEIHVPFSEFSRRRGGEAMWLVLEFTPQW